MTMQAMGTDRTFTFQGTYSESDLDAMATFVVSQSLDQRIGRFTLLGAGGVILLAILFHSWMLALMGFLGVIGISLLARYVFLPRRLIRHARSLPAPSGQRTITIDDGGIHHRGQGSDQAYDLGDIQRAVLTQAHLFLLFRPRGLLMLPLSWVHPSASIEDVAILLARKER